VRGEPFGKLRAIATVLCVSGVMALIRLSRRNEERGAHAPLGLAGRPGARGRSLQL